jgi:hypothetical protein
MTFYRPSCEDCYDDKCMTDRAWRSRERVNASNCGRFHHRSEVEKP